MIKIIVAYSGGKDSQSSLIWAVKAYGINNIEAVFCDTGWENPITYRHIHDTSLELGVKLVTLKNGNYEGMIDMAEKLTRFPSTKRRFCTEELKIKPMIDYVLGHKQHLIIIEGIRADESESRSKMSAECSFFKYYFDPYQTNEMIISALSERENLSHSQKEKLKKATTRLAAGFNDEKYFTYRKKDVIKWVKTFNADKVRPFFTWTGKQVIDYIIENGQQPNILYRQGFKRVGCFPCIMSGHNEVYEIMKRYPERIDEIIEHEKRIGSSFFKKDFVPLRFQTGVCSRTGKKYTTGEDVRKYINNKNATASLFEDESISCSSYYHIYE